MRAVTGTMKIGVVFPNLDAPTDFLLADFRAFQNNAFAGFVVRHQIAQVVAFGRRIFGMPVIVIQSRTVFEYSIAAVFGLRKRARARPVELRVDSVLRQFFSAKTTHIVARIFRAIVPRRGIFATVTLDNFARFRDQLRRIGAFDCNAVFGFDSKK